MYFCKGKIDCPSGQTYLEYALVLAAVAAALVAMTPLIKRGIQAMTLTVADQLGNQGDSDQAFDGRGHLQVSNSLTRMNVQKSEIDYGTQAFNDQSTTNSYSVIYLGFTSNVVPP